LSNRIKGLEDALRTLQSSITEEPHPLLTPDLLALKLPPGVRTHIPEVSEASKEEEMAEVFGTLQICNELFNQMNSDGVGPDVSLHSSGWRWSILWLDRCKRLLGTGE
jgi:hypothetical protein